MKFRKLRIAWSVVWGALAVLLCVLWVRSYWSVDLLTRVGNINSLFLESRFGQLELSRGIDTLTNAFFSAGSYHLQSEMNADFVRRGYQRGIWGSRFYCTFFSQGAWRLAVPHWFVASMFALTAGASWLPLRFSLRFLLVATTVVAILLGLIVAVI